MSPKPDASMGLYFTKQNKCIYLIADTNEPVTNPKRLRTLLGHLQAIPLIQPVVEDYNKLVQAEGAKSWNDTRFVLSKKI